MLAAAVNPNLGGWPLSPVASEIEAQTVRWIAELVGFPADSGGLLVSGGNMANFVCFLAARRACAGWDVRAEGMRGAPGRARIGLKAADLFGFGTDAIIRRTMSSMDGGIEATIGTMRGRRHALLVGHGESSRARSTTA